MTPSAPTLAFVESPVQLLNVLEWAHAQRTGLLGAVPCQPARGAGAQPAAPAAAVGLRIVVLPPTDPMSRGQLRRMAGLARDEGHEVQWQEARGGRYAPVRALAALARDVRAARRVVIGDPFSRYVQLLLTLVRAEELVVVDDGTATMEFVAQTARGERLVRWHRAGGGGLPGRLRELAYAP
ncbi:hypothetical protein ACFXA9_08440, partial [Streptomyces sp. NPDC059411]